MSTLLMFRFYFNFNGKKEELEMSEDELILKALIEEYEDRVKKGNGLKVVHKSSNKNEEKRTTGLEKP